MDHVLDLGGEGTPASSKGGLITTVGGGNGS